MTRRRTHIYNCYTMCLCQRYVPFRFVSMYVLRDRLQFGWRSRYFEVELDIKKIPLVFKSVLMKTQPFL